MLDPCGSSRPSSIGTSQVTIRRARSGDSAALLALQHRLDEQSSYLLLERDERPHSDHALRGRLSEQGPVGSFDLLAFLPGRDLGPVGWIAVEVSPYRRAAHVGHLVLGVDAACSSRGVGHRLLGAAVEECRRRGLRRVELTVMVDNLRAVELYLRCGFLIEGLRRDSLIRDGAAVDEYAMAQLLPDTEKENQTTGT